MSVKVSVIVPVYKTEAYLDKCLSSLVEQTLKDIEIIVVNDGSPDNSQVIIERYAKKYPQVVSVIKENGGLSDARNYGIKMAKGKYVSFIDSDDYVEKDMMEKMVRKMEDEDLDVAICDFFMDYPNHSYILKADLGYTKNALKASVFAFPNAQARMVRTSMMKEHLFRKGVWYEDLDIMPTFAAYTKKIGFMNEPLYHYVQRADSIMNQTVFKDKFYDIFTVLEDVWQSYLKNNLMEEYALEIEYLNIVHLQRGAILRFCDLEGTDEAIEKVVALMESRFPNWEKNPYLKKSSWKFQLICKLGRYRQYWALRLLKKLGQG